MKMKKTSIWIVLAVVGAALALGYVFLRRPSGEHILTEKEVGLPVYPGLRGVGGFSGGMMEIQGEEVSILPVIHGDTADPLEKVVAFYSEKFPEWNRREVDGNYFFWPGDPDEDFNPAAPEGLTRLSIHLKPSLEDPKRVGVAYFQNPR